MLEAQDLASLGKAALDVARPFIGPDLPALDALTVELSHSTAHEADGCGLLLICEHFDVGDAGGDINGQLDAVVANTRGAALLAVAGDAVTDSAKAGRFF